MPVAKTHSDDSEDFTELNYQWCDYVEYEPVFRLGKSFRESFEMMGLVEELTEQLPGLDCGSCGAPTCRALAEDIVRGTASNNDCIYAFHEYINTLSKEISSLTKSLNLGHSNDADSVHLLEDYIKKLTTEMDRKER